MANITSRGGTTDAALTNADFAEAMLKEFGIEYSIGGLDLKNLPTGPFITISNRPYGGADGLVLVDLFGHLRPDFKVTVNQILGLAKRMSCL